MEMSAPITVHVLWGSDPEDDAPSSYPLANEASRAAFMKGVDAADGWMGVEWVTHGNHRVNKDGEVVEGKPPVKPVSPTDRFALWGEDPEPGSRPVKYSFATVEEAEAFTLGADEAAGWTGYHLVPGPDYRLIPSASSLRDPGELTWLTPVGRQRLLVLLEEGDLTDTLSATPDGRWASEDGVPMDEAPAVSPLGPPSAPERRRRRAP